MTNENKKECVLCGELATTEYQGDDMCKECKDNEIEESEPFEELELGDNACINFPWREM